MNKPPQPQRAREAVYRLIKFRARSVWEVQQRLVQKGFDAQVVEETIAWALSCDLLDDAAFAALWVNERLFRRPMSVRFLRLELRHKGVSNQDIERTLSAVNVDERQLIRALIESRLPAYASYEQDAKQKKLIGFLKYRGFAAADVFAVLKEFGLTNTKP